MGTKNSRHNSFSLNGFTLVELMIVIAIIAILAAIAIMLMRNQQFKGSDARRKADLNRIKIAVEEYEKDHNCYPQNVVCGTISSQEVYPYLNTVPCDPTTNASYKYENNGTSCPSWYRLFTGLQNTADPAITPGIGLGNLYNFYLGSANAPVPVSSNPTSTPAGTGGSNTGHWACFNGGCLPVGTNSLGNVACQPAFGDNTCGNGWCIYHPNCTPVQ